MNMSVIVSLLIPFTFYFSLSACVNR